MLPEYMLGIWTLSKAQLTQFYFTEITQSIPKWTVIFKVSVFSFLYLFWQAEHLTLKNLQFRAKSLIKCYCHLAELQALVYN